MKNQTWREVCAHHKANNIINVCDSANKKFEKILDVGAGCGAILQELSNKLFAKSYSALETTEKNIEKIKKREMNLSCVKCFDGSIFPFSDSSFDLVILSHVIEHVENERLLLREIRRVSEYLCIEIPIDFCWDIDKRAAHFLSYGHINVYTPSLLRFLLIQEGFDVICDMTDTYHIDVLIYNETVNKKNAVDVIDFEKKHLPLIADFNSLNKDQKERSPLARTYTALCKTKRVTK